MHEAQGSALPKGSRDSKTACCSLKLVRKVVHKIYLYKKQDHLENRNKMRRATGKPEATLLTTEYLVHRSQRENCRMHGDKITSGGGVTEAVRDNDMLHGQGCVLGSGWVGMLPSVSDAADVLALFYSVGCWLSLLLFLVLCSGQHLLETWEVEGVSFVAFLFV